MNVRNTAYFCLFEFYRSHFKYDIILTNEYNSSIYNFGLPTVIYCDKEGYPKLERYLKYLDYIGVPNKHKLIQSELGDFKYKKQIITHRKKVIRWSKAETKKRQKENPDEPGFQLFNFSTK